MRRTTTIVVTLLCLVLMPTLVGCAGHMYAFTAPKQKSFVVDGSADEAYSAGIKAAAVAGFSIFNSDSKSGTFLASRGSGVVDDLAELNFVVTKQGGKVVALVRAKSNNPDGALSDFEQSFRSAIKIREVIS